MIDSCLVPDFYVHPDYLLVDQVLDQIGKHIITDWNSSIETSKILHQVKIRDGQGCEQRVNGIEIPYLTPVQEMAMRKVLDISKLSGEEKKNQLPPPILPFSLFLRKGYIGQFYSEHNFLENLNSKVRNNSPGHIFCSTAFLMSSFSNQASNFEVILGDMDFLECDLTHEEERMNLTNLLNLTTVRNTLRNALVEEKLCSYAEQSGRYINIPPDVWGTEKIWCRLLIEGFMATIVWIKDKFGFDPPEKRFVSEGRVLFKKSEVKAFLESALQALPCSEGQKDKESWQKLFSSQRPYLKLLNELALSLPEGTIETKFKKELVGIIEKKAKSSGLDVSGRKLEHLATFLRSPEQEKGTAYRSKNKR